MSSRPLFHCLLLASAIQYTAAKLGSPGLPVYEFYQYDNPSCSGSGKKMLLTAVEAKSLDSCCVQFQSNGNTVYAVSFECQLSSQGQCESVIFRRFQDWNDTSCFNVLEESQTLPAMLSSLNRGECTLLDEPSFETLQASGSNVYAKLDAPLVCFPPTSWHPADQQRWPWWKFFLFLLAACCICTCITAANRTRKVTPTEPAQMPSASTNAGSRDDRPLLKQDSAPSRAQDREENMAVE